MEIHQRFGKGYQGESLIESGFYACHPSVSLTYFSGIFCFLFLFSHPVFTLTVLFFTLALCRSYSEAKQFKSALKTGAAIGVFIMVANPALNHRGSHILFYMLDNPVTLESFLYGVSNALTICCLILLFAPLNALIDGERLLYLFGGVLPKTALITNISLRFSHLLQRRAKEMAQVQKTRGLDIKKGNFKERLRHAGVLLMGLTVWTLEDGMQLSQTLKAKGYSSVRRTRYAFFKVETLDTGLLLFMFSCLLACFTLGFYNAGRYAFYPRLSGAAFSAQTLAAYTAMLAFLTTPFCVDAAKRRR
jgi:energy-coupling factor transport system permease protein